MTTQATGAGQALLSDIIHEIRLLGADPAFTRVEIECDREGLGWRKLSFCDRPKFEALVAHAQRLDAYSGKEGAQFARAVERLDAPDFGSTATTLMHLAACDASPEAIVCILALAVAQEHAESRFSIEKNVVDLARIRELLETTARAAGIPFGWHPHSHEMLPSRFAPRYFREAVRGIETRKEKLHFVAQEIAVLLRDFVIVELVVRPQSTAPGWICPFWTQQLERAAMAVRLSRETGASVRADTLDLKWHDLGRDELEALVWSMPTSRLKERFGVSDVAIAKVCKRRGVVKPPPGYWAEVYAGKIPHPEGVPDLARVDLALRKRRVGPRAPAQATKVRRPARRQQVAARAVTAAEASSREA